MHVFPLFAPHFYMSCFFFQLWRWRITDGCGNLGSGCKAFPDRRHYCTCAGEEPERFSVDILICVSQECDCKWSGHRKMGEKGSQGIPGDRCWSSTGKAEGRGMSGHSGSWLVLRFLDTTLSFYSSPPLEESVCWSGVLKAAPVKAAIITLRGWTVAA